MRTRRAFWIRCSSICQVHCRTCSRSSRHTSPSPTQSFLMSPIQHSVEAFGWRRDFLLGFHGAFSFPVFVSRGDFIHVFVPQAFSRPFSRSPREAHQARDVLPTLPPCYHHSRLLDSLEPQAEHCQEFYLLPLTWAFPSQHRAGVEFCGAKGPAD